MSADPWIAAVETGDLQTLTAALRADPSLARATTADGDTLLHIACWQKHETLVTVLLAAGSDPNARGCYGRSPLHYAVHEGDAASVPIVATLMAAGADPAAREDNAFSVEDWAKIELYEALSEVLALLRGPTPSATPGSLVDEVAGWIAAGDHDDVAVALRRDPAFASARTSAGDTLLHVACRTGQLGALAALHIAGADPNAVGAGGETPLHAVLAVGGAIAAPIAGTLVSWGADPRRLDGTGTSALDLAKQRLAADPAHFGPASTAQFLVDELARA